MIVTDYDLAFCKHALYCIYDTQFSKFKVVYKGAQIYYRDRVFFSIDTLFLYAFCHWLFHLFLADLDVNDRTRIKETLDD